MPTFEDWKETYRSAPIIPKARRAPPGELRLGRYGKFTVRFL